jgi:uncharacterized protein YegP (UPF0339 family)
MPGTFEIKKAKDGQTFFHLKAANGQIILASEMYKAKESALNGCAGSARNGVQALSVREYNASLRGLCLCDQLVSCI